jgi:UDP-N-acetylmuramate: L-alanyl-gamma-D-glutamyl-meso-diaminopimelate ligase
LHPEAVVKGLLAVNKPAVLLPNADAIVDSIVPQLKSGDVVAVLSNGGFEGIYEKLPAKLRASGGSGKSA